MTSLQYNDGVPKGSRFDTNSDFFKNTVARLETEEGKAQIAQVRQLTEIAEKELGCTTAQLALVRRALSPGCYPH